MRTIRQGIAIAAVGAMLGTGCSGIRGELIESGYADQERSSIELAYSEDVRTTPAAFGFEAPDLYNGSILVGSELYHDAPLIMTFVVPSCAVCISEGPKLARAAEATPDVNYLVVHSHGAVSDFLAYNETSGLVQENLRHIVDPDGVLWERFGVTSQPSTVMVDANGQVTSSRGALGDDGLLRAVAQVIPG